MLGIQKVLFFHFSQMRMVTIIFFQMRQDKGCETGFFSPSFGSPSEVIYVELVFILGFGVFKKVLKSII